MKDSMKDGVSDTGRWNIEGHRKALKKNKGISPYGGTPKKYKEHKPTGAALALSKRLKNEK